MVKNVNLSLAEVNNNYRFVEGEESIPMQIEAYYGTRGKKGAELHIEYAHGEKTEMFKALYKEKGQEPRSYEYLKSERGTQEKTTFDYADKDLQEFIQEKTGHTISLDDRSRLIAQKKEENLRALSSRLGEEADFPDPDMSLTDAPLTPEETDYLAKKGNELEKALSDEYQDELDHEFHDVPLGDDYNEKSEAILKDVKTYIQSHNIIERTHEKEEKEALMAVEEVYNSRVAKKEDALDFSKADLQPKEQEYLISAGKKIQEMNEKLEEAYSRISSPYDEETIHQTLGKDSLKLEKEVAAFIDRNHIQERGKESTKKVTAVKEKPVGRHYLPKKKEGQNKGMDR